MKELTAGIVSFNRPECLERLIKSIIELYPNLKILIADNSYEHNIQKINEIIREYNCDIVWLLSDDGISKCRNALVKQCKTEYLLILEDDFVFTKHTKLEELVNVAREKNGICGGALTSTANSVLHYEFMVSIEDGILLYRQIRIEEDELCPRRAIAKCDLVFNFFVCKPEQLLQITNEPWYPELKVASEHIDFFLRMKENNIPVFYNANCSINHMQKRDEEYKKDRVDRAKDFLAIAHKLHGITKVERGTDIWVKGEL